MSTLNESIPSKRELSLIAIEAAEELQKLKKNIPTNINNITDLSAIIKNAFSKNALNSESNLRSDTVSIFSRAVSNSIDPSFLPKDVSDLINEANKISSLLSEESKRTKEDDLSRLISFCVALSDSAFIYNQELEQLRKKIA